MCGRHREVNNLVHRLGDNLAHIKTDYLNMRGQG
jgi:hypothetical protein